MLDRDLKPHLKKRMESIGAILVVCEHVVEVDHAVELVLLLFGLRSQFIAHKLFPLAQHAQPTAAQLSGFLCQ